MITLTAIFTALKPAIWYIIGLVATRIVLPQLAHWLKENAHKTRYRRIENVARQAVLLAEEEAASSGGLDSTEKLGVAMRFFCAAFPEIDEKMAWDIIHAALPDLGIGSAAKSINTNLPRVSE